MHNLTTLLWRLIWIGAAALAAIVIVWLVVRLVRRRGERELDAGPFTLEQIVSLHEQGQLTQVEYLQLRNLVLSQLPLRPGFTLHELRQMRERGDVSEQEYEMVRAIMIARLRDAGAE